MFNNTTQSVTDIEKVYHQGIPNCYDLLDSPIKSSAKAFIRFANWDSNTGQELIDQSSSGITTSNIGSTPFNGTGLQVECTD